MVLRFDRPRRRIPEPKEASSALVNLLKKMGLTDQARRLRIQAAWAKAVGPEIAARTEPQSFYRGVLVVKSSSPAWQNELTFLKDEIIAKVNAVFDGKRTVKELKVISGTIGPKEKYEPAFDWITANETQDDRDAAQDAAMPISDPELRDFFKRLVCLHRRADRTKKG